MSAAPKTYTQKFTVYRHDGDHLGNVKPGALLRYAQQIATTHAEAAGLTDEVYTATRTAFVLAKLALHIDRTPRVDEELTLVTQPECCKRAVNKRITHFYDADGAEVAVIDSRWVLIDIDKRIILRKHPEQFADHWAEDVPFALPMKMTKAAPEACELAGEPVASYSRCDMNGHLNNTRYADYCLNCFSVAELTRKSVRSFSISYVKQCKEGETLAFYRKDEESRSLICGYNERGENVVRTEFSFAPRKFCTRESDIKNEADQ